MWIYQTFIFILKWIPQDLSRINSAKVAEKHHACSAHMSSGFEYKSRPLAASSDSSHIAKHGHWLNRLLLSYKAASTPQGEETYYRLSPTKLQCHNITIYFHWESPISLMAVLHSTISSDYLHRASVGCEISTLLLFLHFTTLVKQLNSVPTFFMCFCYIKHYSIT